MSLTDELPPNLEREMRQVLAEMEVWFQYGSTMNFAQSGGGGDGGSGRPPGSSSPDHDYWRDRFDRAFNKGAVLDEARESLKAMRYQKRVKVKPETEAELEARIVREGEGWGITDIANHCRCTEKMVRKARERAGVSLEDGKGIVRRNLDREERQVEAQAMRKRGLTIRQIAQMLKCDVATVHRDLRVPSET